MTPSEDRQHGIEAFDARRMAGNDDDGCRRSLRVGGAHIYVAQTHAEHGGVVLRVGRRAYRARTIRHRVRLRAGGRHGFPDAPFRVCWMVAYSMVEAPH